MKKTQNLQRKADYQAALEPMIQATENQTKDLKTELQKLEPQTINLENGIPLHHYYKDADPYFRVFMKRMDILC